MLLHHSTLLTMSFWSISLLCHMYELFEQLILHRLLTSVEQHLIDVQTGFSPGWSCPQDEQRFLPQWTRTNPAGKPTILCGTLWDIHLMVATKQQFTPRQCPGSNPSQHVHKQPTCVPGHNGLHLLGSPVHHSPPCWVCIVSGTSWTDLRWINPPSCQPCRHPGMHIPFEVKTSTLNFMEWHSA